MTCGPKVGPLTVHRRRRVDKCGVAREEEQDFSQVPLRAPDMREFALKGEAVVVDLE